MTTVLGTERLILRKFDLKDAPFILQLLNTDTWMRFIGDRGVRTIAEAEQYLKDGPMKSYGIHGFGLCCVTQRSTGFPVGACGLLQRDYLPHPDIGFAFLPAFEGIGFGFEIASATLRYAKDVLNLPVILAITTSDNERSVALLRKIGLREEKKFTPAESNEELLLFTTG